MFTKFSMSIAQFALPFGIGFVASSALPFRTIFIVAAVAIAIDGLLIAFLPFPKVDTTEGKETKKEVKKEKMKFTPASIALICIGFTSSSTFMIWLNSVSYTHLLDTLKSENKKIEDRLYFNNSNFKSLLSDLNMDIYFIDQSRCV